MMEELRRHWGRNEEEEEERKDLWMFFTSDLSLEA